MMNALSKKLLAVAAAIAMWAVIQPGAASAQTSGIAGDGSDRLLWRATDSSISLWKINGDLTFNSYHVYGPYDGWTPVAITTTNDNNTVVLWRRSDGLTTLWLVDANLNYQSQQYYGPYYGWTAESLSPDTNGNNWIRLIWRETGGLVSIWDLDGNLTFQFNHIYGPYFGYDPGNAAHAVKATPSGPANAKAAAGMVTNSISPKPFPGKAK